MGTGDDLLRMLEPAVRPDGLAGPASAPGRSRAPVEQRGFDELLAEARAEGEAMPSAETVADGSAEPTATGADQGPTRPLDPLAPLDRVENPGLLGLIRGGATPRR